MKLADADIKKDFEEAYKNASSFWAPYLKEAETDLKFALGDQWDSAQKAYLKAHGREAFTFRKMQRVNKLITGFQRKNRLSFKVNPIEGSDEDTADQFSEVLQWQAQYCNAYAVLSDAFEFGPIITGSNLVELYLDFTTDPLNGDIKFARKPYNRFLLDPDMTNPDFSDAGHLLCREYMTPERIKLLLPRETHKDIDRLRKTTDVDDKYSYYKPAAKDARRGALAYDEFWVRTYTDVTVLVDPQTYEIREFTGKKDRLAMIMQAAPQLKILNMTKTGVELRVFVSGNLMYRGPGPSEIDDFPFAWFHGFYAPEEEKAELKLQGVDRCIRDPQTEANKRRSQMIDILEGQLNSGWKAKVGSVVNEAQLFQSGQGQAIFVNPNFQLADVERLQAAQVPPSMFQLQELFDKDIIEIPGANSELFGMPENENLQVAGILAKMRQGQGLTVLQDIFDHYRHSKKRVGRLMVKMIQKNYTPDKIKRIINQQPTKEFYDRQFGKYDCALTEGVLTDSQRQMSYAQLIGMQQMGAPIPWSLIIDMAPLENKAELKKAIEQAEQQAAQQAQGQQQMAQLQTQMIQAAMQKDQASTQEKVTQAQENRTNAVLDRARAIKEMQGVDLEQAVKAIQFLRSLQQQNSPMQGAA